MTSDLSQFMMPPEAPTVDYHVGQVMAWDNSTGENTVRVLGQDMADLPMLNIGDTTLLSAGDIVLILRTRTTMFIVGRVVHPGSERFASTSVDFAPFNSQADTFAWTNVAAIRSTQTVTMPDWANEALVHSVVHCTGRNNSGTLSSLFARVDIEVPGVGTLPSESTRQDAFGTQLVTTSTSICAEMQMEGFGPTFNIHAVGSVNLPAGWASTSENRVVLSTSVVFRNRP